MEEQKKGGNLTDFTPPQSQLQDKQLPKEYIINGAKKESEINPQFDDLTNSETLISHIEELTKKTDVEILSSLRINPTDEILPPQKAYEQIGGNDTILGTLGNFSLIIGKAKSRKSFFINIAVSTVISEDPILGQFRGALPQDQRKVLYFDTEQGKYHVHLALKRVCDQIDIKEPKDLIVYGLRSKKPSERLRLIEYAIYNTPNLGFVIIDGIKDLVNSINDESEATMIASKLLKWTEEKNIHIITVLHQNKSDNNARGHIGTELINKAETVLSVTKNEQDKDISVVEAQQCRNREPRSFAFEINENGLPELVEDFEIRTSTKKDATNSLLECGREYQIEILRIAFSRDKLISYGNLVIQIKLAYAKQYSGTQMGNNKIKEFITHCKNEELLIQEKLKAPYQIGNIQGLDK
ncbi:MAG: mobilization protein [Flavobacteriales bacterium]|nr:MAG: mobilization protein [Flavobacteriales bacterium]